VITPDLRALESDVQHAIATHDTSRLRLVGHGEISVVLGWPSDDPVVVCKRLPPFTDLAAFMDYRDVVLRYVEQLRSRGLSVVETELHHLERDDRHVIGFHVQPLLPGDALATAVLRRSSPACGHPLLAAVVGAVDRCVTDRVGVDAQLSNWVWLDDTPWQLDLTTPFLLDERRQPILDMSPFLAALPAIARPLVAREMRKLIRRWTTARGALLDLAANLLKEDLSPWLDAALDAINAHVRPPVTRGEAHEIHARDHRLWPFLLRLEALERRWRQRVRRQPYEFLLPEHTTYDERYDQPHSS
jgi:hypothetical protein